MPNSYIKIGAVSLLLSVGSWQGSPQTHAQITDPAPAGQPDNKHALNSTNATEPILGKEDVEKIDWKIAKTRKQLSDNELKHLLEDNTYLWLDQLESLSDHQTQALLGTASGFTLDSITNLSDHQIKLLTRAKSVSFGGLVALTDFQARSLGKCENVSLASLESITPSQCRALRNVKLLELDGLKKISNDVAAELGKNSMDSTQCLAGNHPISD